MESTSVANNTVEQGRIYFSDFSKVFKLDEHFFDVMQWNIGQLLMFVLPIVLFLLAIRFSKKWVQFVHNGVNKFFSWAKRELFKRDSHGYRETRGTTKEFNYKGQVFKTPKMKEYKYSDYGYKEKKLSGFRSRANSVLKGSKKLY